MNRPSRGKGSRERYEYLVSEVSAQSRDPRSPCQEWKYAKVNKGKNGQGHGVLVMPNGDHELVHRVAFFLVHGHWPEPCCIHDCDNPPCFLVAHLREASQLENIADMNSKSRQRGGSMPGESHPMVILSSEQVSAMRKEYIPSRFAIGKLAKKYGVSYYTAWDIIKRRSWQHQD